MILSEKELLSSLEQKDMGGTSPCDSDLPRVRCLTTLACFGLRDCLGPRTSSTNMRQSLDLCTSRW